MDDSQNEMLAEWRREERQQEREDEASVSSVPPKPSDWGITTYELRYTYERSTRNKHRYQPDQDENDMDPLGKIYVEKQALTSPPPHYIHLTVRLE